MPPLKKITYYDLREESQLRRLPELVGRTQEIQRLHNVIARSINNNVMLIGEHGIGKTTLAYGFMQALARSHTYASSALVQLDCDYLAALDDETMVEEQYIAALQALPSAIILLDEFCRDLYKKSHVLQRFARVHKRLLKHARTHVLITLTPKEYEWLEQEAPGFVQLFEKIHLKEQSAHEYKRILRNNVRRLNSTHRLLVDDEALQDIVAHTKRFPSLGTMPRAAIHVLDEALSYGGNAGEKMLSKHSIAQVIEMKTGIPTTQLRGGELDDLRTLESRLSAQVVHQSSAMKKIATTLQRAKLGLRNPDRPLGSFLMLGPSGVGKTETAKCVAQMLFGRSESFVRFDMSEFQQDHTVQRLVGAPAGYVGFEEGGALTNALRNEPHSLILLDEIEKAHPKIFDIFLQVLDDGRITSGQNETVDAKHAIFMATSNMAVHEILRAFERYPEIDEESLIRDIAMPVLSKTLRLEFINRFDSILIYRPLSVPGLVQIAQLELKKIEKRFSHHQVRFEIDTQKLRERITQIADPRFGARPVKRFIEETCETLLMQSLLQPATRV